MRIRRWRRVSWTSLNYSPNAHNETMRTLLRRGMRLSAVGECAWTLLAHSTTALSELKPRISQKIILWILKFFQIPSVYTIWDGLSLKTISRYCPFNLLGVFFCLKILNCRKIKLIECNANCANCRHQKNLPVRTLRQVYICLRPSPS
jgi:hypothetical protein